jgi:hypothetical protein
VLQALPAQQSLVVEHAALATPHATHVLLRHSEPVQQAAVPALHALFSDTQQLPLPPHSVSGSQQAAPAPHRTVRLNSSRVPALQQRWQTAPASLATGVAQRSVAEPVPVQAHSVEEPSVAHVRRHTPSTQLSPGSHRMSLVEPSRDLQFPPSDIRRAHMGSDDRTPAATFCRSRQ